MGYNKATKRRASQLGAGASRLLSILLLLHGGHAPSANEPLLSASLKLNCVFDFVFAKRYRKSLHTRTLSAPSFASQASAPNGAH